jgi:hypothetical protein
MRKLRQLLVKQTFPVLVRDELTQPPQGHSTSGSHGGYKDGDRLAWEEI